MVVIHFLRILAEQINELSIVDLGLDDGEYCTGFFMFFLLKKGCFFQEEIYIFLFDFSFHKSH